MSSFSDQTPAFEPIGNGRRWKVVKGFEYYVTEPLEGYKQAVIISENFTTDFASVPRILWSLFPPYGKYGKAAIVHDWLYENKFIVTKYLDFKTRNIFTNSLPVSRERADEIFLEAMLVLGVPKWKAKIMFYAVRLFGQKAWDN